jgi:hypothetical protein
MGTQLGERLKLIRRKTEGEEVAQTMYTHMSKCKNHKIKFKKEF